MGIVIGVEPIGVKSNYFGEDLDLFFNEFKCI